MPEAGFVMGAILAGALVAAAVLSTPVGRRAGSPATGASRHATGGSAVAALLLWEARLGADIERAGWSWSTRQVSVAIASVATSLGLLGLASNPLFVPLGFAAAVTLGLTTIASSAERRRRRLEEELVPLLELFTLELSAGGSALSALGSVTVQVEGELAGDLRRMLIASQVSGSASFESRLTAYSERLRMPALGSLATILAASREFGTGTIQGVRALATDLRRGQRRELISRSRKALNHVLIPAAFGVLLPFLGILMFPAISVLQRSLR